MLRTTPLPRARRSPRSLRAAARFGLRLCGDSAGPDDPAPLRAAAARLDAALQSGQSALISGASGAGKSTLLRLLATQLSGSAVATPPASDILALDSPVIDLLRSPLDRAMRLLSAAGLGEANLFLRQARRLSDGQRSRLALALAMERAESLQRRSRPITLLADEFGSTLDRPSARCLARTASRWAAASSMRLIVATAHDDLAPALRPRLLTFAALDGSAVVRPAASLGPDPLLDAIHIQPAAASAYTHLARWHYRAGPPATCTRVLAAYAPDQPAPIGVLTVSMPTLNSALRRIAWAGRFCSGDKRADARRLNAELRTISRVVVDPRYRGIGIASRLVRAYLADPLTPATEALAAMGAWCPFFEAAGMRPYELPLARRHARLLRALASIGIQPWELADPARILRRLRQRPGRDAAMLGRELAIWADASRATRRLARAGLRDLLDAAACAGLAARPIGYAHDAASAAQRAAA